MPHVHTLAGMLRTFSPNLSNQYSDEITLVFPAEEETKKSEDSTKESTEGTETEKEKEKEKEKEVCLGFC
jgi:hypothetical protein